MITTTTNAAKICVVVFVHCQNWQISTEFQCSMARLAYADPRTRSKSSLRSLSAREKSVASKLRARSCSCYQYSLTPATIVIPLAVQSLRVLALATSKEWLLERHYGSTWVLTRSFLVAAFLAVCWWVSRRRNIPPIDVRCGEQISQIYAQISQKS